MRLAALILALPPPASVDITVTVLAPLTLVIEETPLGLIAEARCDDPEHARPAVVTYGAPVLAARGVDVFPEWKQLAGVP